MSAGTELPDVAGGCDRGAHRTVRTACQLLATCVLGMAAASSAFAGSLDCQIYSGNGQPYCQYTGRISQVYVNSGNQILLYLDGNFSTSTPGSVGLNVSTASAVTILITDNPEFAKYFYATALAAQARSTSVVLQMWQTYNGYLKADRIWAD